MYRGHAFGGTLGGPSLQAQGAGPEPFTRGKCLPAFVAGQYQRFRHRRACGARTAACAAAGALQQPQGQCLVDVVIVEGSQKR